MKSMTGYAKCQATIGQKRYTIEIKTLNSKQLDLNVKLPSSLRSHELEVRTMLTQLERGKVDFMLTDENAATAADLNEALLLSRYNALCRLAAQVKADSSQLLNSLAASSDLWNGGSQQEIPEEEWETIKASISQAIAQTDQFRTEEGAVLQRDFISHIDLIEQLLGQIPAYETERIATAKERIYRYMADADIHNVDANRFEQELIYYLEKFDITEEKVRLKKHLDYFRQTLATEPTCGKKLGFVAQEMGREINTTGSKANHVEIQRIVVAMKDELEKIKEQLGNVL